MDNFKDYEEACERIRQQNEHLLSEFEEWLATRKLSDTTIRSHTQNIDLFVNHFLLYEEAIEPAHGAHHVGMFLGCWFICKAGCASESAIRRNAASLKKYYMFLNGRGQVSSEQLESLCESIKEGLPDWLATMRRYDDPDLTDPEDIWGL